MYTAALLMGLDKSGWIILALANIPTYFILGWLVFSNWSNFWDSIKFWFTPDVLSLFNGERVDNFWAEMKILWWILLCVAVVFAEAHAIEKFFLS